MVRRFDQNYRDKVAWWRDYPLPCLGCGIKQYHFVNVVPEGARISALVDVNPHKQERFAPGTGTAVVGPESLRGRPVRSIIVMTALSRRSCPGAHKLGLAPDIIVA
ncbi:MAG: hypothetical protein E5Y67_26355 [Mesorhizobium sp.]|uniref:hypothetical protein n=1 Tax=Mesorhizobium sp. TaxID=1871066 RepID=UPI00121E232E|nr:hypothetical protein [Mesorhizobium sp.]TIM10386.1 MAG: hypothetical protein E5Y67_26355 [Mesorhizobium sp.]